MEFKELPAEEKDRLLEMFFIRRFNKHPEHDPDSFGKWKERFADGDPQSHMDSESLAIFESSLKSPYIQKIITMDLVSF